MPEKERLAWIREAINMIRKGALLDGFSVPDIGNEAWDEVSEALESIFNVHNVLGQKWDQKAIVSILKSNLMKMQNRRFHAVGLNGSYIIACLNISHDSLLQAVSNESCLNPSAFNGNTNRGELNQTILKHLHNLPWLSRIKMTQAQKNAFINVLIQRARKKEILEAQNWPLAGSAEELGGECLRLHRYCSWQE